MGMNAATIVKTAVPGSLGAKPRNGGRAGSNKSFFPFAAGGAFLAVLNTRISITPMGNTREFLVAWALAKLLADNVVALDLQAVFDLLPNHPATATNVAARFFMPA